MASPIDYVEALNGSDEAERIYAAEDIGYLNSAEGVAPLLARLEKEPSRAVREIIFQALIRIDADAAIEGTIGLLVSEDTHMRNQAVEVLRSKGAASIPFLDLVMRRGDKQLRKLVLDVLNGMNVKGADEINGAALSDPDSNVVITAVENLGKARATQFSGSVEALLLASSHPMLMAACLEALAGVGNDLSLRAIRQRFPQLEALPDFLLGPYVKAIGALGAAEDFAEVANLLAVRGAHLRPAILGALFAIGQRHSFEAAPSEELLRILRAIAENGEPPLCRYQAARALGFMAARDDVYEFLLGSLAHPDRLLRLGAIESLLKFPRPGLPELLASRAESETDEEVLQALCC